MPVINYDPAVNDKTVILYSNLLEETGNTYSGHASGHSGENALTDTTYDYWQQDQFSNTSIVKDGAFASRKASALGVSGHTLGSTGSTLRLEVSEDLISWSGVIAAQSPITDDDLIILFPEVTATHWRVRFGGGYNTIVSNIKLGIPLVFPCTPIDDYTPVHHSRRYKKEFNTSIKGHLLGNRVQSSGFETSCDFPLINRAFVDGPLLGFEDHYNRGRPFFYAGWPNGKPQDMGYAWASSDEATVSVTYVEGDKLADVSFSMQGFSAL